MDIFKEKLIVKAINDKDTFLAPYLAQVDKADAQFITNKLTPFSNLIKGTILTAAFNKPTNYDRNRHILDTSAKLASFLPKKLAHMFFCFDDDINVKAKACANYCRQIVIDPKKIAFIHIHHRKSVNEIPNETISVNGNTEQNYSESERNSSHVLSENSVNEKTSNSEIPLTEQKSVLTFLSRYVESYKINPIELNKTIQISGCLKRYADNRWWLRKFRKLITQANEKAAIQLNFVNSKRQVYASNITTKNRIAQRLRNDELLSSSFIINEQGQRYSLKDISDLNVSNPKIRKDELICRARGFENLAKDLGHEALFITITCPSKYHRAFSKSGATNPKWQGLMPDEANEYLNHQWQKARAEFKRQNITPYGFRVVEPQHDGTPHWHMLFFIEGEKLQTLQAIIRHYALEIDGDEKGAAENRCDFKKIDPTKGSATGYILKYIVKNIDGEGIGEDKFGNDSILVAQRIDAWASCWCIRQFQQIGGASVSVWRELRRLRTKFIDKKDAILEQARFAADNSDWQGYTLAMGGIHTKQKNRPLQLHYDLNINEQTGECLQSYYDGELILKVKGLWFAGKAVVTRHYQWKIEKA
ncbi:replication endonuclease [Colwellia sp. MB02u-18]|uniref:replication endonuclease n=1 Tax=unclassified Colwellia TaxID=196834 RepID=UPI0015F58BB8|nr:MULTISPECIES: replication endonuclease [unclassified Colwellia]MBA6224731.1 replication endonuclease [Colwellia sp. MB3u-45]MBA6266817.1 replication endonuclease [Colwellia sp. MB3u-43]MBA6321412.1 replication endonuclease [Colwellia sp. MB02u-19]MBA6323619.1 replication endonuclease [Colwellia sp. MB02u-18]MBA6332440.1 replication endonuclease [Colwellia sp. MB02u-12]